MRGVRSDELDTSVRSTLLCLDQHLTGEVDSQANSAFRREEPEEFARSASNVDDYLELFVSEKLQYLCMLLALLLVVELVVVFGQGIVPFRNGFGVLRGQGYVDILLR